MSPSDSSSAPEPASRFLLCPLRILPMSRTAVAATRLDLEFLVSESKTQYEHLQDGDDARDGEDRTGR